MTVVLKVLFNSHQPTNQPFCHPRDRRNDLLLYVLLLYVCPDSYQKLVLYKLFTYLITHY